MGLEAARVQPSSRDAFKFPVLLNATDARLLRVPLRCEVLGLVRNPGASASPEPREPES